METNLYRLAYYVCISLKPANYIYTYTSIIHTVFARCFTRDDN